MKCLRNTSSKYAKEDVWKIVKRSVDEILYFGPGNKIEVSLNFCPVNVIGEKP